MDSIDWVVQDQVLHSLDFSILKPLNLSPSDDVLNNGDDDDDDGIVGGQRYWTTALIYLKWVPV